MFVVSDRLVCPYLDGPLWDGPRRSNSYDTCKQRTVFQEKSFVFAVQIEEKNSKTLAEGFCKPKLPKYFVKSDENAGKTGRNKANACHTQVQTSTTKPISTIKNFKFMLIYD